MLQPLPKGSTITEEMLLTIHNVTKFMAEPTAVIHLEHRVPYHEKYQMVEANLISNRTDKQELKQVYKNVLFMTPMVDRRFYDGQSWASFIWTKYFGITGSKIIKVNFYDISNAGKWGFAKILTLG